MVGWLWLWDGGDHTWGEVVKDSLVIKNNERVGWIGMSARLVGSAALYLDIAPMKLKDLREVCKTKNVALAVRRNEGLLIV